MSGDFPLHLEDSISLHSYGGQIELITYTMIIDECVRVEQELKVLNIDVIQFLFDLNILYRTFIKVQTQQSQINFVSN